MDMHAYLKQNPMYVHRAAAFFTTNYQERNVQDSLDRIVDELDPPGAICDLLDSLYESEKIPLVVWYNYTVALKSQTGSKDDAIAHASDKMRSFPDLSDEQWKEQVFKPVDRCVNPPQRKATISYLNFK